MMLSKKQIIRHIIDNMIENVLNICRNCRGKTKLRNKKEPGTIRECRTSEKKEMLFNWNII